MSELFAIIIGTALVNHLFLEHALGAETMAAFSRRMDVARGLSISLILLMPFACLIAYVIHTGLLSRFDLGYLSLPVFIIVIFAVMAVLKHVARYLPETVRHVTGIFFPLAGINTAVLGALLLTLEYSASVFSALLFGLGSALGFSLSLLLMSGLQIRLESIELPEAFRGLPIYLITAAVMSMAFAGFLGLVQT
ncbi:MAG: hypothetical protein MI673_07235 [Thiotrichales bacterium]|nr:hypothetical protein [Thiotrichales bacterium]